MPGLPPIFGINNRSLFAVPLGPVKSGMKALRSRATVSAHSGFAAGKLPLIKNQAAGTFPNGKKARPLK